MTKDTAQRRSWTFYEAFKNKMEKTKSSNTVWHDATITKQNREHLFDQRGVALWFTGLSGSGKSTVANAVENRLFEMGYHTYVLDGFQNWFIFLLMLESLFSRHSYLLIEKTAKAHENF